jgi:hypothetical protein
MMKPRHRAALHLALIVGIASLALPVPAGCADVSATTAAGIWPRLIVDVLPHPDPGGEATGLLRVRARLADGTLLEGIPQGCPDLAQVLCSFSFFTAPRDKDVVLIVESRSNSAASLSVRITLGRFSYRGCRMTHVTVGFTGGGQLQIGAPRQIDASVCGCP